MLLDFISLLELLHFFLVKPDFRLFLLVILSHLVVFPFESLDLLVVGLG